jgi:hypothetical protein
LATQDEELRGKLGRLFSREGNKAWSDKSHSGVQAFKKSLRRPVGEILPFVASKMDLDLAALMARQFESGLIFSQQSLVHAGAIEITTSGCQYCEEWFSSQKSGSEFRITPNEAVVLQARVKGRQPPVVEVAIGEEIHLLVRLSGALPQEAKAKRSTNELQVQFFDPRKLRANTSVLRGVTAKYDRDRYCIDINVSTPEAILQLSAYASEGLWLLVVSDSVAACLKIPPLDEPGPHRTVWATEGDDEGTYVWTSKPTTISISMDLAAQCAKEFHWFYFNRDLSLVRRIAKETAQK